MVSLWSTLYLSLYRLFFYWSRPNVLKMTRSLLKKGKQSFVTTMYELSFFTRELAIFNTFLGKKTPCISLHVWVCQSYQLKMAQPINSKNSLIFFVPLLVPPFLSKSHGLIQLHIWQQCEKMFSHDGMQRLRTKLCKQVHNAHPSQLELNVKQTMEARTKQLCKRKPQCNCENTSIIAKHELLVHNWL